MNVRTKHMVMAKNASTAVEFLGKERETWVGGYASHRPKNSKDSDGRWVK